MLKQSVKNYFKSLKYFFTPLGTMFLGMMIGFSVLFPCVIGAFSTMADNVKALAENVSLDWHVLADNLWEAIVALDWEGAPSDSLATLFSGEWWNGVLTQELTAILGTDFETFTSQIVAIVAVFTAQIAAGLVVFVFFWVIGFIAGFLLVKFFVRRDIARRSIWKWLLASVLNSVLSAGFMLLAGWCFVLWAQSLYIFITALLLFSGSFVLLEAYLLHGRGKIEFRKIVNFKNIALNFSANLIIFAVSICLSLIAFAINKVMGIFVGLSIVVVALIVIDLNAEAYVKNSVGNREIASEPSSVTELDVKD